MGEEIGSRQLKQARLARIALLLGAVLTLMTLELAASAVPSPASAAGAADKLGVTVVGPRSAPLPANDKWVTAYRLPVGAELRALTVYLAPGRRSARQLLEGVVYSNRHGTPDQRVGVSRQLAFNGTQRAGRYTLEFVAPLALAPGTYWIGLISGERAGAARYRYSESAHARCVNANRFTSGPSRAFGRCTEDARRISLYATYVPLPTPRADMPAPALPPAVSQTAQTAPPQTSAAPLPVSVSAPMVSGIAQPGRLLTASTGAWSNEPTNFTYEWLRCDTHGEACNVISLATSTSYAVVDADIGHSLRVSVDAWNAAGASAPALSQPTEVVSAPPAPPTNTSPPVVSGVAEQGQTLSSSTGTWSGEPTSYAYEWLRCDSLGEECVAIAGANSSTYALAGTDVGATIMVSVTASNEAGSSREARSAATEVVSAPGAPTNTSPPLISGVAQLGQLLSSSAGAWSNEPTGYAYKWLRCDPQGRSCSRISGATTSTYLLAEADVGHTLRVAVIASNATGPSKEARSAPTEVVSVPPSPPANTSPPVISGVARQGQQLSSSTGTWSNEPTSYVYEWLRCDSLGEECVAIAGANASTYTPTEADVGATVRAAVVASNTAGSSEPVQSMASEVVSPPLAPPTNTSPPLISGAAGQGQQLSSSTGTWSNEPTSYSYEWLRCDALGEECVAIPGANSSTYTLTEADVGATIIASVIARNEAGLSNEARSAPTEVVTTVHHFEYVFNDGPVSVYDIDHGFKLVESFSLPGTTKGVRGVMVSPSTHMMFVSYGGDGGTAGTGSVLAYELVKKEVKWSVNLSTGIDSGAVSNDGKLLYMPDGAASSDGNWYILSTADGSVVGKIETAGTGPHDGVLSADGKTLQLGDRNYSRLAIYNTQTGKVEKEVGKFVGGVRPNTIDGSGSLSFITANNFDGFQIGSISTGTVLYTESFATCSGPFTTCSHGISLSPDSRQAYVIDTVHKAVQAWDVHGVAEGIAPVHLAEVPVDGLEGKEEGCSGSCEREGWVRHTLDGRYVLVGDSGDVIETATQKVVAKVANLLNTREYVEIDWSGGVPIASSGRQGIGY